MKKMLLLTLILWVCICAFISCDDTPSNECESHVPSDKIVAQACAENVNYYIECTLCHAVLESGVLNNSHIYVETVISPSVTEQGYTQHKCSECGDEYVDSYVPALGFTSFAYTINKDGTTCTITGIGAVTESEITIPLEIDGYSVTTIGDNAFINCTNITKVLLQDSIKHIGKCAFYGCTGLTEITIPASLETYGDKIFYKADNLTTVYYNSSSSTEILGSIANLSKVVFGGSSVPTEILKSNKTVKYVEILDSVTSIDTSAFNRFV